MIANRVRRNFKQPIKRARAKPIQHETGEQIALFYWASLHEKKYPALKNMFHPPNGGSRHAKEAENLRLAGVRSGVPDVILLYESKGSQWPHGPSYHGLVIEMKWGDNTCSDAQEDWLARLKAAGFKTAVCYSWQEAAKVICDYLGIPYVGFEVKQ